MIGIFEENGYDALARALAPLEESGVIHYLPEFECCSRCAWRRIFSEDEGWTARGFVTFNEQAKDRADETCELWLTVSSFSRVASREEVQVRELVRQALLDADYTEVFDDDFEGFSQDQESNSFYVGTNGIEVLGFFSGAAGVVNLVEEVAVS